MTPDSPDALAFDRRNANRRPIFSLNQRLHTDDTESCTIVREWHAAAGCRVFRESADWHSERGLLFVCTDAPSLQETASAKIEGDHAIMRLCSPRTDMRHRDHRVKLAHPPITLASAPLAIASAWQQLHAGEQLKRSYLVLKVQRVATVNIRLAHSDSSEAVVEVTPAAWPLRLLFGSTRFVFASGDLRLLRIDGLLDPRDYRYVPRGRWREYFGRIEFQRAIAFGRMFSDRVQANGSLNRVA
jgi:hypothetical protein